jgi:hypothetical protein
MVIRFRQCLAVLGCVLLACQTKVAAVYADDEKAKASLAVSKFHERLNAAAFDKIIEHSSERLKKDVPRDVVLRSLREAHEQFGSFVKTVDAKLSVLPGPPVEVRGVYTSNYANGLATEVFSLIDEGGAQRLLLFKIYPGRIMSNNLSQP